MKSSVIAKLLVLASASLASACSDNSIIDQSALDQTGQDTQSVAGTTLSITESALRRNRPRRDPNIAPSGTVDAPVLSSVKDPATPTEPTSVQPATVQTPTVISSAVGAEYVPLTINSGTSTTPILVSSVSGSTPGMASELPAFTLTDPTLQISTAVAGSGTGFRSRPFLWQADLPRLIQLRDVNSPWAFGGTSNSSFPQAFLSVMIGQLGRASPNTLGAMATNTKAWELALAGTILEAPGAKQDLINGRALRVQAKNEALGFMNTNVHPLGTSDIYQHSEEAVWAVGATLDLCADLLSAQEKQSMAMWLQTAVKWIDQTRDSFWPGRNSHNNYWQNGSLAKSIAGIVTEGILTATESANLRRGYIEDMATWAVQHGNNHWQGPQLAEGRYYSTYTRNATFGMKMYDQVLGTNFQANKGFSTDQELKAQLMLLTGDRKNFMSFGDDAADATGAWHPTSYNYMTQLAYQTSDPALAATAYAVVEQSYKAIGYGWTAPSGKAFSGFYWSKPAIAPAITADMNYLELPVPGAGLTLMRSASGLAGNARTGMFSASAWAPNSKNSSAYSHAHYNASSIQWTQGGDKLFAHPNNFTNSGLLGQFAYIPKYTEFANTTTLASASGNTLPQSAWPSYRNRSSGNLAGSPFYYQSVDLTALFPQASRYNRETVWLDDLQVVLVCDRINTNSTDPKTFRLHVTGAPVINGSTVSTTTSGGARLTIRDLTNNGTWASRDLLNAFASQETKGGVWALTQTSTSDAYISIKVADVNGRVSAANVTQTALGPLVTMNVNGTNVSVQLKDDLTQAVVK
jgi:hypothetical protein